MIMSRQDAGGPEEYEGPRSWTQALAGALL